MGRPRTSANTRKSPHRLGRIFVRHGRYGIAMPPRFGKRSEVRVQTGLVEKLDGKVVAENLRIVREVHLYANHFYDGFDVPDSLPDFYVEMLKPFGYKPPERKQAAMAHEVWDVFLADIKQERRLSGGTETQYDLAKNRYLPNDIALPVNDDEVMLLARQLVRRRSELKLSPTTKNQSESRIKKFFTYCVRWKYAVGSPFAYIDTVDASAVRKPPPLTIEELISLDEYLCNRAGGNTAFEAARRCGQMTSEVAARMMVRIIFGTAARIAEAVALRRDWLTDDHVELREVKGGKKLKNPSPPRRIDYDAVPGLAAVVSDCLQMTVNSNSPKLLPIDYGAARYAIDDAAAHFGWPEGRRWHSIRKTAINYWRDVLGIPHEVREDMAGQSEDVAKEHYLEPRSSATMRALQGKRLAKIEHNRELAAKLLCSVFD